MNQIILIIFILLEHHYYYKSCEELDKINCQNNGHFMNENNELLFCRYNTKKGCFFDFSITSCSEFKSQFESRPTHFFNSFLCPYYQGNYPCEYNDETDNCNEIIPCVNNTLGNCTLKIRDDETIIKCKWKNNQCIQDKEITTCEQATDLNELSNEQCSKLPTSNNETLCVKGSIGCMEVNECSQIIYDADQSICEKFTKEDSTDKCVLVGNGCNITKKNCLDSKNSNICSELNTLGKDYKCFYDGSKCNEANSCELIKNTSFGSTSKELKKICELFEYCEPYGNGCKKSLPTTIPK